MLAVILSGTLLIVAAAHASAGTSQDRAASSPVAVSAEEPIPELAAVPPVAGPTYLFPDLADQALIHDGKRFWVRPIIAILADYTFFEQDDASLVQVGQQEDTADLRAARFGFALRSKSERAWEVFFAADYLEERTRENDVFQLYDLRLRIPFGRIKLDIGKQKQPFALEMQGLSLLNSQQERILSPFFVTRSIGMQLSGPLAGDRMTWAVGWFNDWMETGASFSDNANDYVGRITGLLRESPDNTDYLHLGLGVRRVGPDAGIIRMSGRPESKVTEKYVDTGEFTADFTGELSLEAIWNRGPFGISAEHIESRAEAPDSGNPRFSGSYVMLSWTVTGESRRYNRAAGMATGITPTHPYGAIELVARYSRVDLKDAAIDGGVLDKMHFGVNWWTSRQWKVGISYGDADLGRAGIYGNTRMLLCRLQWFY
jgi:phosphate-selective porin OprO/OprP